MGVKNFIGQGSLYLCEDKVGNIKIGVSKNHDIREKVLQTGNAIELKIIYVSKNIINAYDLESNLHKKYNKFKVKGEWFNFKDCKDNIIGEIISFSEEYGVEPDNYLLGNDNVCSRILKDQLLEIKEIEFETLLMERDNKALEQLVFDYSTGERDGEYSQLILKHMGEKFYEKGVRVIDDLVNQNWGYDQVKDFIEKTNTTRQIAG